MHRKLFFWLEKLKITPHERVTITGLMALLVILSLLDLVLEPRDILDRDQYEEIRREFRKRSAQIKKEKKRLMKRYNPQPGMIQVSQAPTEDTTPGTLDTTRLKVDEQDTTKSTRININHASKKKLETLPGIGPVYAGRIVTYRQKEGPFKTVGELVKIKGIGEKRLQKLKPLVEI